MINHIVLLKLRKSITKDQLETLYTNILGLKNKIPGIISISIGKNNSPEGMNKGFSHGFTVQFRDLASRDNYLPHPEHVKVSEDYILPIIDAFLVFDYETKEEDSASFK